VISLSIYTSEPLNSIALEFLFRPCEDITLLPVVSDLPSLPQQVSSQKPNVLLLAVNADLDWDLLTRLWRESADTKVVLWLHEITPELAYQAMERGVKGILRKNLPPEMILKCVRRVYEGELWFEKTLTEAFRNGRSIKVSNREGELITLVAQGLKNREIAEAMCITEGTVKVYLSRLFEKVGARDRIELALIGLRNLRGKSEPGGASVPALPYPHSSSKGPDGPVRKKAHTQSSRLFFARPAAR
jgi:two-component system, NarL family, nitrate/nitrite response regulator NarL